jgi:hypothetical protein
MVGHKEATMADWGRAAEQIGEILAVVRQLDDKLERMWGRKKPACADPADRDEPSLTRLASEQQGVVERHREAMMDNLARLATGALTDVADLRSRQTEDGTRIWKVEDRLRELEERLRKCEGQLAFLLRCEEKRQDREQGRA